jgi:hypothetical protein
MTVQVTFDSTISVLHTMHPIKHPCDGAKTLIVYGGRLEPSTSTRILPLTTLYSSAPKIPSLVFFSIVSILSCTINYLSIDTYPALNTLFSTRNFDSEDLLLRHSAPSSP